jgi:outer membrane protein OmpA-like peptidoglycan-associated protein
VIRRFAPFLVLPGLVFSMPVLAQVHVDTGALDKLTPSTPAPEAAPAAPQKAPVHRPARVVKHPAPAHPARTAAKPATSPPHPASIAPAPPPAATLAPLAKGPQPRVLPPPVIPVIPNATGDASSIPGGLRVTFGAGQTELNPATVAALHDFAKAVAPNPTADVNIYAYAAGAADDPSTPRRLSLSRALAARTVLLTDQIASTRIYVHALGASPSQGPPDRVDVQLAGAAPAPSPPPPLPGAAAPRTR